MVLKEMKKCKGCNKEMIGRYPSAQYCTEQCKPSAYKPKNTKKVNDSLPSYIIIKKGNHLTENHPLP